MTEFEIDQIEEQVFSAVDADELQRLLLSIQRRVSELHLNLVAEQDDRYYRAVIKKELTLMTTIKEICAGRIADLKNQRFRILYKFHGLAKKSLPKEQYDEMYRQAKDSGQWQ